MRSLEQLTYERERLCHALGLSRLASHADMMVAVQNMTAELDRQEQLLQRLLELSVIAEAELLASRERIAELEAEFDAARVAAMPFMSRGQLLDAYNSEVP